MKEHKPLNLLLTFPHVWDKVKDHDIVVSYLDNVVFVLVRFISSDEMSALEVAEAFVRYLYSEGITTFEQVDDNRVRLRLECKS